MGVIGLQINFLDDNILLGVYIVNESMGRTVESSLEFTGLFLNKDRIPQYKGELHLVSSGAVSKKMYFWEHPTE